MEDGSPKILHAFSGKAGRHDGLSKILNALGIQCQEMDTLIRTNRHDLCDDKIFQRTLRRAKNGYYTVGVFGVPCSTFSVARIGANGINEPKSIRDRENPKGITNLTTEQQTELDTSNLLIERSVEIALAIATRGWECLFRESMRPSSEVTGHLRTQSYAIDTRQDTKTTHPCGTIQP